MRVGIAIGGPCARSVCDGRDHVSDVPRVAPEHLNQGRPMVPGLVWHSGLSGVGIAPCNLGIELGSVRSDEDDLAFATRQVKAIHEYWAKVG